MTVGEIRAAIESLGDESEVWFCTHYSHDAPEDIEVKLVSIARDGDHATLQVDVSYLDIYGDEDDEERDTAVDELIEEWHSGGAGAPLHEHLGLTEEQYGAFLRYGELPPGYVPPNRDGHRSPVESARSAIVHVMLAVGVALFMLWFFVFMGAPR